jgi:hypothetical protein
MNKKKLKDVENVSEAISEIGRIENEFFKIHKRKSGIELFISTIGVGRNSTWAIEAHFKNEDEKDLEFYFNCL